MKAIEGTIVAGPTWGMALFKDTGDNSLYTLGFHHDPECQRPYKAVEVDPTIAPKIKAELDAVALDRLAETPMIDRLK